MKNIKIKCPAKINLFLEIQDKRDDGYHNIDTIFQSIDLFDEISIHLTNDANMCLTSSDLRLSCNADNLICKAAKLFFDETGITNIGVQIALDKKIPISAGMAGGSTDAAGTLIGLNKLFDNPLGDDKLLHLASFLGADVPFCLVKGTARAGGIGERLEILNDMPNCCFLVVKDDTVKQSTALAYKAIDDLHYIPYSSNNLVDSIFHNDIKEISQNIFNRFETIYPNLYDIKQKLISYGAMTAFLSGSGPTYIGMFDTCHSALPAYEYFSRHNYFCTLCSPLSHDFV